MRIAAISDLHGILPEIPSCDLLLIAGDVCPAFNHDISFQRSWLDTNFKSWLESVPARNVVAVAGNHDLIFEQRPDLVPHLPWTYLQDSGERIDGLKIWGSPWQLYFCGWAFNLYEEDLRQRWSLIPDDSDILVLHGPPLGYGDNAPGNRRVGSPSLLERIGEIKPKLVVYGHIHEGRGRWELGNSILANVTLLDGKYKKAYEPMIFDLV